MGGCLWGYLSICRRGAACLRGTPPHLNIHTHAHALTSTPHQINRINDSVVPDERGRKKFKIVYVVLESQYQSTLTAACQRINEKQENVRGA